MEVEESAGGGDTAQDDKASMPWSAFNKYFKFVGEKDTKNFLSECKLCVKKEAKSCSYNSSSNLKGHLMRVHGWKQDRIDKEFLVKSPRQGPASKRKAPSASDASGSSGSNIFQPKRRITQEVVNKTVDEFVICTRQPHRIVDNEYFRRLALLGLPDHLVISCRQTFRKRMESRFETMRTNILKELANVKHVASAADGWSKFRRGFVGVVITWLDPQTLVRMFAALALQRLKGRHTHDRIAKVLNDIFAGYLLEEKMDLCTTDSGSNFIKAFKVFGPEELPQTEESSESETDGEEDPIVGNEDVAVLDLDKIFDAAELDGIALPKHTRCGAHILNRMATGDANEPLDSNPTFKKIFDSTESKLRKYWRLQNKSTLVAESIQEGFGVKLVVPGDTRWNSKFDAKNQIVSLINKDEDKFNEVVDGAGLPKLSTAEIKFLKEYVHVMRPVAFALDILQKDKNMYLGYMVPTILSMEKLLQECRYIDNRNLKYCQPLVAALISAIRKPGRFLHQLNDREMEIAAALIPCFKLGDWVPSEAKREEIKAALLQEMKILILSDSTSETENPARGDRLADNDEDWQAADDPADAEDENLLTAEDKFFGFRPTPIVRVSQSSSESAEQELQRYLDQVDRSWTVQRCYAVGPNGKREFPRLAMLFLRFNTGLPSSATIERFFSAAGLSFDAIRTALGDRTLEMETVLAVNKAFWT